MAEKKEETVRWRETKKSPPSGFNGTRHGIARIVEGPASSMPDGATKTDEAPHGWKLVEEAA